MPGEGAVTGPLPAGPVVRLLAASLGGALILPAAGYLLVGAAPGALALAMAGYLCGVMLVTALMRRAYPFADLGLGNVVTLARLVLTSALLAPLVAPGVRWGIVGLALLALFLDGVDGWLARRQGRESPFGARFDMEVDAAFGLILAANAFLAGSGGPAVLLLGLPRYAFAAAARAWPWLARALPERTGRKVVCVVQLGALIALQLPALPAPAAGALVSAALAALSWSFGRDVLWLWRARP
ncbi:CDP-alcohol phosphatidyltransferase family protein [Pseudohaliea rubra]|uniref:CDP-alcohol phosphatidyltransferase n=1 Tax=Pseudohaliea rubra DSM 19751 TaxID=1265313 RepID=A0A095XSJ5_9GAMM|nr:CDP-alcohol phosphatidyltransferase family protein [Pseudohaliea rubra]KGE02626.1 CDP-alcohol phosphatidyltransferase [Pseudohaliea rubra DSM 19751]